MVTYNSVPPEVVARAIGWLGIQALGRLSPVDQASNRLASTAFEVLAKRRFTSLSILASSGRPKDWREQLRRHLCFALKTHPQRGIYYNTATDFLFVFEWFDGDPETEGTKSLGSTPALIARPANGEGTSLYVPVRADVLDSGPPAFVQCYVQKRGDEDRCALLYRGGVEHVVLSGFTEYESVCPWLRNSWTDFPPADHVTTLVYCRDRKDLFLAFLAHGGGDDEAPMVASEIVVCLDHHLAYH